MADPALSDPQDPLPEANWLWRRVFIFGSTATILYLVYRSVDRLGAIAIVRPEIGIPAFVAIVKLLVITINILVLYYIVAPSAEQITKLVKTASLLKAGVQIASRAKITTSDRMEETQATVGQPPQPVVPPESAPGGPLVVPRVSDVPEDANALPDAPWAAPAAPPSDSPFTKGM